MLWMLSPPLSPPTGRTFNSSRTFDSQLRWLQTELCAFGCPQRTQPKHQSPRRSCERPLYPCLRAVSLLGPAVYFFSPGPHFAECRRCFLVAPLRPRRLRARHPRCSARRRCRSYCCVCSLLHAFKVGGPCSVNVPWRADGGFARGSHVHAETPSSPPGFPPAHDCCWSPKQTASCQDAVPRELLQDVRAGLHAGRVKEKRKRLVSSGCLILGCFI